MTLNKAKKKSRSGSLFSFSCRCRNSKSVSTSASTSESSERSPVIPRTPREASSSSGDTPTSASFSLAERERSHDDGSKDTTSFSGLLRELNEMEECVKAWGSCRLMPVKKEEEDAGRNRRHMRSRSEGRVKESVAIVKETADPLGDFRKSMLQMIVEKEIVGRTELRELLRRFLTLNSPRHHDLILCAFAEIWAEVFSGYEDIPNFLGRSLSHSFLNRPSLV